MMMLVAALLLGLVGIGILWRVPGCPVSSEDVLPGRGLSIVVPARNEAENLPVLLRSMACQRVRPLEVLVVDDASTDDTAGIARENGARVLSSSPLPAGWSGKSWACQQGAESARGELLLFVDADTWFEPDGLGRILQAYKDGGGVLSVGPYHVVRRPHEQLSAFFNLIMTAGMGAFTLLGNRISPQGLFGQMLLVERSAYFAAGGHAAVRGRILENFSLAKKFQEQGMPLRCLGGRGVFSFRMYPNGMRDVVHGWTKSFAAGAGQVPLFLLLLIVGWVSGLIFPLSQLPLAMWIGDLPSAVAWAALYAGFALQVHWQLHRVGSFHWLTSLCYPIPLLFFFFVFARSLLSRRFKKWAVWKGRTLDAN